MDISCNIIRDLLPLYAEDLASEDTKKAVEEHLRKCKACADVLHDMQKTPPVLVETEAESLNKIKKDIRRRRLISVMAAVMTLLTVASSVITYLFTPFQLTKDQALDDFYIREDGAVVIDYSPYVIGRVMSGNGENWYINQYSNRYDMWKGDNRKSVEELFGTDGVITEEERQRYEGIEIIYGTWQSADGSVKSDASIPWVEDAALVSGGSNWNWWYADPSGMGKDVLLHDAGKPYPETSTTFSLIYPILFFGGIAMVLIFLLIQKTVKKTWAKELSARVCIFAGALAASVLLVSSGRVFTSTVGIIDQYWGWMIPLNTIVFTLTGLFTRQLYELNKQDKGQ